MALTRITKGVIKPNENYQAGIVTATGLDVNGNGDISGDLNVGGILTYEDVTSIDSVGIITAQKGIHVGAGVSAVGVGTFGSLDIGGDIDVDGHTNLDNVSVAGVTTFAGNIELTGALNNDLARIKIPDGMNGAPFTGNLEIGNSRDFVMLHDGHHNYVKVAQNMYIFCNSNNLITLQTGGTVLVNRDLDVDGHTNLDNVSVAGVTTATGNIHAQANIGVGVASPSNRLDIAGSGNQQIQLVRNDGNNGFIFKAGSSHSTIFTYGGHHYFKIATNNVDRLQINNTGVTTLTGNVFALKDFDVDGHTNLDNVSVSGITTFTGNTFVNDSFTINDTGSSTPLTITGNFGTGDSVYIQNNTSGGHIQFGLRVNDSDGNHHRAYITAERGTGATANGKLSIVARRGNGTDFGWIIDAGVGIQANYNVIPETDSTHDLGTSSVRWANVYADTLYGDGSNLTGITQTTINNNANNRVITGSGTANTLEGESNLTFTGSILTVTNSSGASELTLVTPNNTDGGVYFNDGSNSGALSYQHSDDSMRFRVNSTEKLRIDSNGDLGLNTTPNNVGSMRTLHIKGPSGEGAAIRLQDVGDTPDSDDFTIYKNYVAAYLRSNGADPIIVHQSGSERLRIDTNGNTLIGGIRTTNTGFGNKVLISGGTLGLDGNGSNIGMHFHRNSGDTEGYIGIGPWAVTGGTDDDFGFAAKGDLLFGTSSSTWAQKMRVADNGRVKIGTGAPKAQLDIKQQGNSWEDALLIQHDNANTGWNIHAERSNSALWFGYNSNTGSALTDQTASQVLHLNSNRTTSLVYSDNSYELTIGGLSGGPTLWLRDSTTSGTSRLMFGSSAGALDGAIYYKTDSNYLAFYTNGNEHIRIDQSGNLNPYTDASRDLGTSSLRWRNVYTTDLQLSNENTGGNEVDGTEGNWTLQEGESDVYMINRKTGKKYKMMLKEVD